MHAPETKVTDPRALLDQHRRDIEALDRRILHLVCERLELARQVGDLKRDLAVPLRNFKVEAQVYRRFEDASSLLGLDAGLGRDLARFLIEKAVEEQATLRDAVYAGDALDTVVVGGKGGMGRWMCRLLAGQGHRVRVIDPSDGETPFEETDSLADAVGADLIMVAVPMSVCPEILDRLPGSDDPHAQTERRQRLRLIGTALRQLDEELSSLVLMRDFAGMSYREISEALDLPLGTVKSRLNRARMELATGVRRRMQIRVVPPAAGTVEGSVS